MWRKTKRIRDEGLHLVLPTADGVPIMNVPADVVNALRHMMTRLNHRSTFPSRLALVAAQRGEGVTYLSRALGLTMAHDLAASICVVEVNWWWPAPLPERGVNSDGLAAVISGQTALDDALLFTTRPNLALLPAGHVNNIDRPAVARSAALRQTLKELSGRFDHLILDVPAVLATSDAIPLASLADGCCLVIRQNVTSTENVRLALDDVQHMPILGVVMNQAQTAIPAWLLKYIPQD
jgi:Mrp family chromosome partitioning ATPase